MTTGLKTNVNFREDENFLYGTGANGKSVLFDVISALFGSENITSFSLNNLNEEHNRALIVNKMRFDVQTGKRQIVRSWTKDSETHELKAYWMHKELITRKAIDAEFNLKQCFFGEHLLREESNLPVAVVESEKTAIICAIWFPKMLWLAVGAKGYLTDEKFRIFAERQPTYTKFLMSDCLFLSLFP